MKLLRISQVVLTIALVLLSLGSVLWSLHNASDLTVLDNRITASDLHVLGSGITFILSLILLNEFLRYSYRKKLNDADYPRVSQWSRICAWASGFLIINSPVFIGTSPTPSATVGVPAGAVLSPAVAASVLAHVLRRRREQLSARFMPDYFTGDECEALSRIQDQASQYAGTSSTDIEFPMTPDVSTVMLAVDRALPPLVQSSKVEIHENWLVEVKVFGFPLVVNTCGDVAEFRKKRSLELLTWLTFNRDRARRSAARTALWDIEISDSTFSTVVSELRRSLREIVVSDTSVDFVPTTYTDELQLSDLVTTDSIRLEKEFSTFLSRDCRMTAELREVLLGMRDIPFAGTRYSWADLDGTTTRLIITAVEVCRRVAEEMGKQGNTDDLKIALTAGLRVFPGCEDLLAIQHQYLRDIARTA